jgi:hypothetical protein
VGEARFQHLSGARRGEVDTLPEALPAHGALLGRDPQHCLVRADPGEPGVSRRHAQVWQQGGRWWIRALRGSGGTRVNGQRVGEDPVALPDGAVVALGEGLQLRVEIRTAREEQPPGEAPPTERAPTGPRSADAGPEGTPAPERGSHRLALGALALAVLMAGAATFQTWRINKDQADLTQEKAQFFQQRTEYMNALWSLHERRLEEVEDADRPPGAPLPAMDPEMQAIYDKVSAMGAEDPEVLRGDPLAAHARRMVGLLIGDTRGRSVDRTFLWKVEDQLALFLGGDQSTYCTMKALRPELLPILEDELRIQGDPAERAEVLLYLAWIESGYSTTICSNAGARGMWQFITESANHYGIVVEGMVDERCDWRKATRAAVRHIHDGFEQCGDDFPLLAIATYNTGAWACTLTTREEIPESDRDFLGFLTKGYLAPQTIDYLPRLIAASFVGEDREAALAVARRKYPHLPDPPACGDVPVPPSAPCPGPPSCRVTVREGLQ